MLKKSGIVLSSYTGLQNCYVPHPSINTSPSSLPQQRARPTTGLRKQALTVKGRGYATASSSAGPADDDLAWPEHASPAKHPTPYEIFKQKRGSPYSKRRFYELVKIYHPDRSAHPLAGKLSDSVRLERYRLIVAANDILSDPEKRRRYDSLGIGWNNGRPEMGSDWSGSSTERGWYRRRDDPIHHNATWEDWERYYQGADYGRQEPVFFSHLTFVSLIAMFAALGGVGQMTRFSKFSEKLEDRVENLSTEAGEHLNARRKESMNFVGDREKKVEEFLKARNPWGNSALDPQDDTYQISSNTDDGSTDEA